MWEPKYLDHKLKAQEISDEYKRLVVEVGSGEAVDKLCEKHNLNIASIYRYLRYKNVEIPKRKRGKNGKFKSTSIDTLDKV